jgi:hypothetical protein
MQGTLDDFEANGGNDKFLSDLSGSLNIPLENVNLVKVYEGSIVTVYDLIESPDFNLSDLKTL